MLPGAEDGPSTELADDKIAFGADRVLRWFGSTWHALERRAGLTHAKVDLAQYKGRLHT